MTEVHGWERPKYFAPAGFAEKLQFRRTNTFDLVAAEVRAVRDRVGIMDLSSFAKFDVTGPGAEALLDRLTANRLPKKLDGKQEAFVVALACSNAPEGRESWTLQLLADKLVELKVVDTPVSYETIRATLKKTNLSLGKGSSGASRQ